MGMMNRLVKVLLVTLALGTVSCVQFKWAQGLKTNENTDLPIVADATGYELIGLVSASAKSTAFGGFGYATTGVAAEVVALNEGIIKQGRELGAVALTDVTLVNLSTLRGCTWETLLLPMNIATVIVTAKALGPPTPGGWRLTVDSNPSGAVVLGQ